MDIVIADKQLKGIGGEIKWNLQKKLQIPFFAQQMENVKVNFNFHCQKHLSQK